MWNILQEILNHCFEDMEKFMTRLQQAAEAQIVLNQRKKRSGRKDKKSKNQGSENNFHGHYIPVCFCSNWNNPIYRKLPSFYLQILTRPTVAMLKWIELNKKIGILISA